eukprot:7294604-Alexandrium_andersonii.AAC.1
MPNSALHLRVLQQALHAVLAPGTRGHGMLVQEVRAALKLRAVDVDHEPQVHIGFALALGHVGRVHAR